MFTWADQIALPKSWTSIKKLYITALWRGVTVELWSGWRLTREAPANIRR